jgi:hypothetical protein
MPEYRYEAVNDADEKLEGTMTASNIKEVIAKIMLSRYYPMRIEELSEQSSVHYRRLDNLKQIRNFFRPQQKPQEFKMPATAKRRNVYLIILILAVLFWVALLVICLAPQAQF